MSKNVKSNAHGGIGGPSSSKSNSKSATVTSAQTAAETETAAGAMHIPIIRSKDNAKQLPVYYASLQRCSDDHLAAENLDAVQLELEKMLSNVALRYRVLKCEYESLDRDEKRNERRLKHASSHAEKAPSSPASNSNNGKRKREEQACSALRKSKHSSTPKHSKYSKGSSALSQHSEDSSDFAPGAAGGTAQSSREHQPKLALPKNDMPNKFWLSVEPYCMPLTNEDLRLIDELLEQYDGPLVPPIPELGAHYSSVWAQDQLKEVQQNSNNARVKSQSVETNGLLKRAETLMDECVTGPLTQRLVTALMEEQLLPSNTEESNDVKPKSELRSLALMRNCIGIEQRIKQELLDQGILEAQDLCVNGDEDEIHSEIKRLVAELSSIAEYNSSALSRLREAAAEEIKRLEIKRKLDAVDQEIMEAYKRSMQSKAKRKPLTAEEQHEIFRLTTEQKTLSDQLERAQAKTFLYE